MDGYEINVAAVSETGSCKQDNQDCVLARVGEGPLGDFGLFTVADGMGSQAGGREAAEMAVRICEDWWLRILPRFLSLPPEDTLQRAVSSLTESARHLNEAVIGLGRRLDSQPGTTFSALFLYGGRYGYVHLGDSRIYHSGANLTQLTPDDTWVAVQVASGAMSADEARRHPRRHVLIQCAGSCEHILVHQGVGRVARGDGFILCSDGFYHPLGDEELAALTAEKTELNQRLSAAVGTVYSRGASDNLSAIVITV